MNFGDNNCKDEIDKPQSWECVDPPNHTSIREPIANKEMSQLGINNDLDLEVNIALLPQLLT